MKDSPGTLLEVLKAAEKVLKEKGIDSPRLNAELLLAETLKVNRIKLYTDFEKMLSDNELEDYRDKIRRRMKHEPLQYITGNTEFYGLKFKVNKHVLIPRQETEILTEQAIEEIRNNSLKYVLEIGTGSGCISIAVSKETQCRIKAIDNVNEALETAKENSVINGTGNITFENCDILTYSGSFDEYDIVVSNPPYIPAQDMNDLQPEVRDHEPAYALTDKEDGLKYYKRIIEIAGKSRESIIYLLEIGDGRRKYIEEILKAEGINNYSFHKDLMGTDRVLRFELV